LTGSSNEALLSVLEYLNIPLSRKNIQFPDHVTNIKIDVGLSSDAPQSFHWLESDPNVGVIGIEPLDFNVAAVKAKALTHQNAQSLVPRFHILPFALGPRVEQRTIFITAGDAGSSSLFMPLSMEVLRKETIPVFRLEQVLALIDSVRFPMIDYLKTDSQGSDLEILQSGSNSLQRVAIVTAEAENKAYLGTSNSEEEMDAFMSSIGFVRHNPRSAIRKKVGGMLAHISIVHTIYSALKRSIAFLDLKRGDSPLQVEDPTFVNRLFADRVSAGEVTAWQKG
jgi:FkbM family methyltransferase